MAQSPEELRQDIEETRHTLGRDVDALNEKVSPGRVVSRKVERTRESVTSLKDRVMGTASTGMSTTSGQAGGVGATLSSAPDVARRQTEGNPLAAGLVAFSAGWLVSSLMPATKAEKQAAEALQAQAQNLAEPVKEQLSELGDEMKSNLQGPAQEAAHSVQQSAQEAVEAVKSEGQTQTQQVTEEAKDSAKSVRASTTSG
jgi:gas vesicle protein